MADCPLAMQRLQQIAKAHEQRIYLDDPDTKLKALDNLESQLAYFLGNYKATGEMLDLNGSNESI